MQTYEEQKAFVSKLNVIDDVFFQKMAEDREVAEEILRIILEKPKLKVIDSKVQRFLRNIGAHSVVLDLICEDENHSIINYEVQKEDDDGLILFMKTVPFTISTELFMKREPSLRMGRMRFM